MLPLQDQTFVTMFKALEANINPTVTGLALRLSFHDAATWNPYSPNKGGLARSACRQSVLVLPRAMHALR